MNEPFSSLPLRTRIFAVTALVLCGASAGAAFTGLAEGDATTALLGAAVTVFAGWMASAIIQFQQRMTTIDRLVEEARRRIDHSDRVIGEVRRLAESVRNDDGHSEDRTVH